MQEGYVLERKVLSDDLVAQCRLVHDQANSRYKQTISGQYEQLDILNPKVISPDKIAAFRKQLTECLLTKLSSILPEAKDWVSKQMKFLTADPDSSEQMPHRDSDDHDFVTCAIYLTHNHSTDVSIHPYANVDLKQMSVSEKAKYWPLPWPTLSSDFKSFPVAPGDTLFFRPDFLHRGIKNTSTESRLVLFVVLGPEGKAFDDSYSIFEHIFAEKLHGRGSAEHLASLSRSKQYFPIEHYPSKRTRTTLKRKLAHFERQQRKKHKSIAAVVTTAAAT